MEKRREIIFGLRGFVSLLATNALVGLNEHCTGGKTKTKDDIETKRMKKERGMKRMIFKECLFGKNGNLSKA